MRNILEKIKPTLNKVLGFLLLIGIVFSVITIINAAAPNPGHNFTESSGGVVLGNIIYGSGVDTLAALAGSAGFLKSTGAAAPAWSTVNLATSADVGTSILPVANGGTGASTANAGFNALSPMTTLGDIIYGGVSGAGTRLASVAAGSYLRSGGVGAAPVWSTPTLPNTASNLKLMIGNATNWVESTPAYPNAAVTAGKVIVSDGTNYIASTPTFPNASATSRKKIVSDGTNWVASTETWAVPGATAGNLLMSDGTNWTSAVGGVLIGRQTLTSGTTYTPTTGTNSIIIRLVGGGGGGGGATGGSTQVSIGGGGGSGSYAEKRFAGIAGAASYTIAIGALGAGGAATANGSAGTATTFACPASCTGGALTVTANGGAGGIYLATGSAVGTTLGGAGGAISTNGDVNMTGQPGQGGYRLSGTIGMSGVGGVSKLGSGGNARNNIGGAGIGNAGGGYGAGGGGALSLTTTGYAGGAGTAGVIIVWEFR